MNYEITKCSILRRSYSIHKIYYTTSVCVFTVESMAKAKQNNKERKKGTKSTKNRKFFQFADGVLLVILVSEHHFFSFVHSFVR